MLWGIAPNGYCGRNTVKQNPVKGIEKIKIKPDIVEIHEPLLFTKIVKIARAKKVIGTITAEREKRFFYGTASLRTEVTDNEFVFRKYVTRRTIATARFCCFCYR